MTVRELIDAATRRLGGTEARIDAELLLAHALGKSRAWLYAWPEHSAAGDVLDDFERLVAARARGEPIAYLVGRREFWSLDLAVTRDVLIPRPETELLVECALGRIPGESDASIADLGTGSGAIALAIARERPHATIVAVDASVAALDVAQGNARRLALRNIDFVQSDWFSALDGRAFDVVVSNPPYIAAADSHLGEGDVRFEPRAALVSGADGLDAIRSISAAAPLHLRDRGWLLLEHGWDQGLSVRTLLAGRGFTHVESVRDVGGHERVTLGCWSNAAR